ncbi:MAG: fasciclin domain-containing protein [Bacteroidaceae bacterium]|nr:fasciclin domain-containing protein [Bacteroidaceae bacterium]
MKKNINKSIRTGILVFTGLLVSYACSDTWDDHYDPNLSTGNVVDATIYQQIKSTNELSDFLEILDKTGYSALLDESQIVTVFAPVNGSFNKDSLLTEIANGHKDQVITRFVKNHIARYNYSSNTNKQDIMLLNQKKTTLTNGVVGVDSVHAKSVNTVCNNGILHVMNSELTFHPNIYELLELDPDVDSMYTIIKYYDDDSLDVTRSVYRGVDEDGNRIYVDSVMIKANRLMQRLDSYIYREDSNYLVIAPRKSAYNERYQLVNSYFNFNVHEDDRDSLQQYYANYFTLNTLFYNRNANIYDKDSLVTTTYSRWDPEHNVFYKPYEEEGLLAPGSYYDKITCSNGIVYKTDSFPTSIYDAFFHEIKLEAEGNINIEEDEKGNQSYTKNCNYSYRSDNVHPVSERGYLDVMPATAAAQPYIAYNIPNTLSGKYDIYLVTVPLKYGRSVEDADTLKGYQFRVNMFYRTNKATDTGSQWPKTRNEVLKNPADPTGKEQNFRSDPEKIDTIFLGTVELTECYYRTSKAGVMIQIQSYVSSSEAKTYSRRMLLDRLVLRPHGMPIKQDEDDDLPVLVPENEE